MEARDMKYLPTNSVMISINQPDTPLFDLQINRNNGRVLTLQFNDVTAKMEIHGQSYYPITDRDAVEILDFIDKHRGKDFIVHCAAGISRSAAVCLYLNVMEGYELKKNFWQTSRPNPYVMGKLMIAKKQQNEIYEYREPYF